MLENTLGTKAATAAFEVEAEFLSVVSLVSGCSQKTGRVMGADGILGSVFWVLLHY
jgi:hypothetical protein